MARAGADEAGRRKVHALGALEHPKAPKISIALAVMLVAAQGYQPQVTLGLQRRDPPMPNSADHSPDAQFRASTVVHLGAERGTKPDSQRPTTHFPTSAAKGVLRK